MRRRGDRPSRPGTSRLCTLVVATLALVLASGAWVPARAQQLALTIHVVPPFAGAQFALDGEVFASNSQGVAVIPTGQTGTHVLEALPIEELSTMRVEFARWGDDFFQPRRNIDLPRTTPLEVGYELSYPVTIGFVDLNGEKVSPRRVTSVTIRNTLGSVEEYEGPGPHWFQAVRLLRRFIGLTPKPVQYSVETVMVDGSNVVQRAEQRFFVTGEEHRNIKLLLYSVRFTSQDALFGSPIGSHVLLEYPDGEQQRVPLAEDGTVEVSSLARGSYMASVEASGISPPVPVSVSRNFQEATLKVISYLDIGLFLFVLVSSAIGLALIGRPRLRSAIRSKMRLRWGVHPNERLLPWT
jgi:hypothetical protein